MRYNTVLFDLDGTLTDSYRGIMSCAKEALHDCGIDERDISVLRSLVGPPLHQGIRDQYGLDEERSARVVQRYRELYNERGMYENTPFGGIMALLEQLRAAGVSIGVVTSKAEPIAHAVLDHFGISQWLDCVSAPHPSETSDQKAVLVRAALDKLSARPAVMVGDRVFDIGGARANGIDAIYVMYGYGSEAERDACKPDFAPATVAELAALLLGGGCT